MSLFDRVPQPEAASFGGWSGERAVTQTDVFEDDRAAVVQIDVSRRRRRMIVLWKMFFRRIMHAKNFDPIVLEIELVSLRRDLNRIRRGGGKGEQKEKRQETKHRHRYPSLGCLWSCSLWLSCLDESYNIRRRLAAGGCSG